MNDQTITFYSLQKSIIGYKALHAFKSELTTATIYNNTHDIYSMFIRFNSK